MSEYRWVWHEFTVGLMPMWFTPLAGIWRARDSVLLGQKRKNRLVVTVREEVWEVWLTESVWRICDEFVTVGPGDPFSDECERGRGALEDEEGCINLLCLPVVRHIAVHEHKAVALDVGYVFVAMDLKHQQAITFPT
ncbi:hypothetical protein [Synoicihabitans lomoniglobus]|uniref:hypothetical protein n=1 Tax=Synoicihabitans lomoniglobus TaxID=2909285 RepID=UPI002ED0FBAC|nr:hypothetical protein [Opitutaceae bacterium LMO-M01]